MTAIAIAPPSITNTSGSVVICARSGDGVKTLVASAAVTIRAVPATITATSASGLTGATTPMTRSITAKMTIWISAMAMAGVSVAASRPGSEMPLVRIRVSTRVWRRATTVCVAVR